MSTLASDLLLRPVSMRARALPKPLASKRDAEVFALDDRRVLKLFRSYVPAKRIDEEHRNATLLHGRGIAMAAVESQPVRLDDGRRGLVYERLHGETVGTLMLRRLRRVPELSRLVLRAQEELHALPPVDGLPLQRPKLREKVARSSRVPLRERQQLLALLDAMPEAPPRLCHGNYQPGNLFLRDDGTPVVLSWGNACNGDPECDLARTTVLLGFPAVLRAGPMGLLEPAYLRHRQRAWLDPVAARPGHDASRMARWVAINAAVRLDEQIDPRHHARLLALVRQAL